MLYTKVYIYHGQELHVRQRKLYTKNRTVCKRAVRPCNASFLYDRKAATAKVIFLTLSLMGHAIVH